MTDKLEPCPFCGSDDVYVERGTLSSCLVQCNSCGARGPDSCDETEADVEASERGDCEPGEMAGRRLWNTRTTASSDVEGLRAGVAASGLVAEPWELDDPEVLVRLRDEGMHEAADEIECLQDRFRIAVARATLSPPEAELHPIMSAIMAEVENATRKFPTWPTRIIDAGNVVSEEAGELAKACLQVTYEKHKETLDGVRMEAIQTAAMCFRFLVSMDRYDTEPGEQHEPPRIDATLGESA